MAVDGRAERFRPDEHVRRRSLGILVDQRPRAVQHRLGAGLAASASRAGHSAGIQRRRRNDRRDSVERLLQTLRERPARERATPAASDHGQTHELHRVVDPGERRAGPIRVRPTISSHGVRERDEMAGEIAAVDRRDVLRLERLGAPRVVPVVEVAAEALEAPHRLERGLETLDGVERAEPAEIARGHRGQQIQADVRGRRAMRDDRARRLLEVVGRQARGLRGRRTSRRTATSAARSTGARARPPA